jgi:hypothetical protein
MKLKTAIEILDYHQEWRLGKRDEMIHEPKKLTEALDTILSEVKNNVSRSFYCQREIEGRSKCTNQCEHCKEYYKPLEQ